MKHFKSAEDLQQLSPDDPAYPIVTDLVQRLIVDYEADGFGYDPEADGWVVLVEPHDVDRGITEIWDADTTLADLLWEGFTQRDEHFIGIYLANNQFGLAVVIPDAPWLNGKLRHVIQYHLDPQEIRHV
jgi:hypothetical protein